MKQRKVLHEGDEGQNVVDEGLKSLHEGDEGQKVVNEAEKSPS
ncbi:hypothetical protein [Peribacillus deserti]|nr:hypothetical protein [Peribacillus deserti]